MKLLILATNGEPEACRPAQEYLEQAGYGVRLLSTSVVLEEAKRLRPSLVLIAALLPDGSGAELCRTIRRHLPLCKTPIILLIAATEEGIAGLEAGADDCLSSPFSSRELVARVQAVLRRREGNACGDEAADFVIDRAAMKLSVRGNEVSTMDQCRGRFAKRH